MKVYIKTFFLFSICVGVVIGCSNETVKPDSSDSTAWLMKLAIDNDDYADFNSLFSDGRKGNISESDFKEFKDITTAGADYKRYELLTFENGNMLLVRLTPPNENNIVEIEDVIIVPEDMKELFND